MRGWLRISLRTLLAIMVLVSVYLGGRYTNPAREIGPPRQIDGAWQMTMPRGFQRSVQLVHLADDKYQLEAAGVLNGLYRWNDGRLIIVTPGDKRMTGLIWEWHPRDKRFLLIREPENHPTGSSYLGAILDERRAAR